MRQFDLIVIGSGTAGQAAAYGCREAGWSVAVIDPRPPGGTCANRGCDAKKPLVNAAAALEAARRFADHGLDVSPGIDWPSLMRFKRSFTDPIPQRTRGDLADAGISLFDGWPRFTGPDAVEVNDQSLRGRRIVLATGLKPRPLNMPGDEHVLTSDDFLELDLLPRRIVFIGGGYISMEFAHAAARAGSDVTVLEQGDRPLKQFDAEIVAGLQKAAADLGIRIVCGSCVTAIERDGDTLRTRCNETGKRYAADAIVHGAGRVPSLDGLNLEAANVSQGEGGVVVDDHLRCSSNPAVYAAGDAAATDRPKLLTVASLEGDVLKHNLLHEDQPRTAAPGAIPAAAFTIPPMAMVGLTEAAARERGLDIEVKVGDADAFKVNRELAAPHGCHKVLVDRHTRQFVGAHLYGPGADELINLFSLSMHADLTVEQFKAAVFAYPTLSTTAHAMV